MFWFSSNLPQEWWLSGRVDSSSPYDGSITQVTQFSLLNPHGYLPCSGISPLNGTVTYVTEFTDENGVKHKQGRSELAGVSITFVAGWGGICQCVEGWEYVDGELTFCTFSSGRLKEFVEGLEQEEREAA
jgi:hypothetical protein